MHRKAKLGAVETMASDAMTLYHSEMVDLWGDKDDEVDEKSIRLHARCLYLVGFLSAKRCQYSRRGDSHKLQPAELCSRASPGNLNPKP